MQRNTCVVSALMFLSVSIPLHSQAKPNGDIDAIREVEQAMGSAMVAGDANKLKTIYADDFAAVGSDGKLFTKEAVLADIESSHDKLEWFDNGPIDVQVFGDYALAQGLVKERRTGNGREIASQSLWQDLLKKRDSTWVVWRSAGAKVFADQSSAHFQEAAIVATIKKFENDLGNAMVTSNLNRIDRAYADDWETITSTGELFNKKGLLQDFESGNHKLQSFENGPMNVQVLGNVALVQASVKEKRIQDGKDISGLFIFMDLLQKRAGEWVIVRTIAARPA
ncbi:MAG TPA: nuclear transport factor 2 family protein [Terracidiphilus sp.]|nr:nuclear transport factor 2 family protein [Terracidiphilus sp.]